MDETLKKSFKKNTRTRRKTTTAMQKELNRKKAQGGGTSKTATHKGTA